MKKTAILILAVLLLTCSVNNEKNYVKQASLNDVINIVRGFKLELRNSSEGLMMQNIQNSYYEFRDSCYAAFNPKHIILEDSSEVVLDNKNIVYGFYPGWSYKDSTLINFNLINRIGYFALKPDSSLTDYCVENVLLWDNLKLRNLCKKYKCNLDLVIFDYLDPGVGEYLFSLNRKSETGKSSKNSNRKKLIDGIINLLNNYGGDGVTIGFWALEPQMKDEYTQFLIELSVRIKNFNSDAYLNVMLPPDNSLTNAYNFYDFEKINEYVDLFLLFGFEYNGDYEYGISPAAPLYEEYTPSGRSIVSSIKKCIDNKINKEKIILVVPTEGKKWQAGKKDEKVKLPVQDTEWNTTIKRDTVTTYLYYKENLKDYISLYDYNSASSCFLKQSKDSLNVIWTDDSLSILRKSKFIKENHLSGIGLWNLSQMDRPRWSSIAGEFAIPAIRVGGITIYNPENFLILFYSIYALLVLIFIFSMLSCPIQTLVEKNPLILTLAIMLSYILIFLITFFSNKMENNKWVLICLFIISGLLILGRKIYIRYKEMSYP